MNKSLATAFLFLLGAVLSAEEPIVTEAPDPGKWTLSVRYQEAPRRITENADRSFPPSALATRRLVRSETDRVGMIRKIVRRFDDGSSEEVWVIGDRLLKEHPQQGYVTMVDLQTDLDAPAYATSAFPGLQWLEQKYLVGTEMLGEILCDVYEWTERVQAPVFASKQEADAALGRRWMYMNRPVIPTRVWIDKGTRLPVRIEDEQSIQEYRFDSPSSLTLQLPSKFRAAWDNFQASLRENESHRMVPPR